MHTKPVRILAIDPGTRELGVAVLEGAELLYYAVKTIRNRQTPKQVLEAATGIIKRHVADYQPETLAIEKLFLVHKSAALLLVVTEQIKATARKQGLNIYEYVPTAVRRHICKNGKATKQATAQVVASRYVELARYLQGRSKWEELYYANMFDAIAVGLTCHQQLLGNNFTGSQNLSDSK
jgi:Holliday junction resolvasome RuvABC endonuclease subunit